MEDWMKALNGHVHVQYIHEHRLHGKDYWDEGKVELTLWKVPTPNAVNTARRPVGIRSVPDVDGKPFFYSISGFAVNWTYR
jgi:hypothetical protein